MGDWFCSRELHPNQVTLQRESYFPGLAGSRLPGKDGASGVSRGDGHRPLLFLDPAATRSTRGGADAGDVDRRARALARPPFRARDPRAADRLGRGRLRRLPSRDCDTAGQPRPRQRVVRRDAREAPEPAT